jgi:hypothetical protein
MHLRRRHKITGLLQIINRKTIDTFVRLVFIQHRGFYGWHVLVLNKYSETVHLQLLSL